MIDVMTNDTSSTPPKSPVPSWWLWAAVGFVLALWAGSGLFLYYRFDSDHRGTFGDMFGAANALFSGLAFATLIYTMFLQRAELELQRNELRDTRSEMVAQKQQMEIQNGTMRRQAFETTFFNLIELLSGSVKSLECQNGDWRASPIAGRACFPIVLSNLGFLPNPPGDVISKQDLQSLINLTANELVDSNSAILSQYNSILEQIILFIDSSQLGDDAKDKYAAILQSVLSEQEKVLLFYLGLSTYGQERLKPYIERYALLTNLSLDRREIPGFARSYYKPCAFGAGTPG